MITTAPREPVPQAATSAQLREAHVALVGIFDAIDRDCRMVSNGVAPVGAARDALNRVRRAVAHVRAITLAQCEGAINRVQAIAGRPQP